MTRIFFSLVLLPIAACLAFASTAHGYSRAYLPLPAAVSQADAIVVASITTAPPFSAKAESTVVTVEKVFKGILPLGPVTVLAPSTRHYSGLTMAVGTRYILFLQQPTGQATATFVVMEDGTRLHKAEDAETVAALAAQTPAWSAPTNGISTVLLAEKTNDPTPDDINIWIGCRNASASDVQISYNKWPLATHTFWTLEITDADGKVVAAQANPTVTPQEINDYFSKHGKNQESTLGSSQHGWFRVSAINSAKPGWGFKEELDFKFYPMPSPGKYTIIARGHNVLSAGVVTAGPITIVVE